MADENTQVGQGQAQGQDDTAPVQVPATQPVDLRAEKAVINDKGEVVATSKESKLNVASVNGLGQKLNVADSIKDPVERMKQGLSVNMPKIRKTVFENVKGMFEKATSATKSTVDKIDKVENLQKETGQKVVITPAERQKYVEAEKIYQDGLASIKDLIAPASMEINYDTIRLDGMYARSFYCYAYPRFLNTNWLSPVINFDVTMDMSQFIYPINP